MKYLGSKNRIAKELVPIIESYITEDTKFYIEPFVGGANMIDKINFKRKIGSDIHKYLIALLTYAQDLENKLPETISEDEYNKVKDNNDDYPDWYVGLVGFCATFSAKWFGGYARAVKADKVSPRDMSNEAIRNLEKQRKDLQNIVFFHSTYEKFNEVSNSVIYCDIPYRDTTKFKTETFDYEHFYEWCKQMKSQNNIVFISEYNMPEGNFECIWEKEHSVNLDSNRSSKSKRIERLYITK